MKCGKCCTAFELDLIGNEDSVADAKKCIIANFKHHGLEVVKPTVKFKLYGRCVNLADNNLCRIYDTRPAICRRFACDNLPISPKQQKNLYTQRGL